MHDELSNKLSTVQQEMAAATAETQRARASEQTAWQAQMASAVRAGQAEAVARAAAMGEEKKELKKKKRLPQ